MVKAASFEEDFEECINDVKRASLATNFIFGSSSESKLDILEIRFLQSKISVLETKRLMIIRLRASSLYSQDEEEIKAIADIIIGPEHSFFINRMRNLRATCFKTISDCPSWVTKQSMILCCCSFKASKNLGEPDIKEYKILIELTFTWTSGSNYSMKKMN